MCILLGTECTWGFCHLHVLFSLPFKALGSAGWGLHLSLDSWRLGPSEGLQEAFRMILIYLFDIMVGTKHPLVVQGI